MLYEIISYRASLSAERDFRMKIPFFSKLRLLVLIFMLSFYCALIKNLQTASITRK